MTFTLAVGNAGDPFFLDAMTMVEKANANGGDITAQIFPRPIGLVLGLELSGNPFFGFVPSAEYIRPIVGMATNTTAKTRLNPTDNYQFLVMGAMGLEIRADYSGKSGVFYSTDV